VISWFKSRVRFYDQDAPGLAEASAVIFACPQCMSKSDLMKKKKKDFLAAMTRTNISSREIEIPMNLYYQITAEE
jgi:hypothetical protein